MKTGYEKQAEHIYSIYPRKVGRPSALRAIHRAMQRFPQMDIAGRTKLFAECWSGAPEQDMRFCPHPSTWFNQDRFNDEPVTWQRRIVRPQTYSGKSNNGF